MSRLEQHVNTDNASARDEQSPHKATFSSHGETTRESPRGGSVDRATPRPLLVDRRAAAAQTETVPESDIEAQASLATCPSTRNGSRFVIKMHPSVSGYASAPKVACLGNCRATAGRRDAS